MEKIIFHIDVNNAFLSWTACHMLKHGATLDIREIPSAIAGSKEKRAGIILAKSQIAKKCEVRTAETIHEAQSKCRNLQIFPPNFEIYSYYSNMMYRILCNYSDKIERYSIDECFLDYTSMQKLYGKPLDVAKQISNRIFKELGFTVNVGIGNNRLLAKMASELEKPNKINTIYTNEIQDKMWRLPIEDLFMVGRRTVPELKKMSIYTIGDLAKYDKRILKARFKKFGEQMYNYANGIDDANIEGYKGYKGLGNSITTSVDIRDRKEAYKIILSIAECVGKRLRNENMYTQCISVSIKNSNFETMSHQLKLNTKTNSTKQIYEIAKKLFDEIWKGQSIRSFGIRLDKLTNYEDNQLSLFDDIKDEKKIKLDKVIDNTRNKYGDTSLQRAIFLNTNIDPILNANNKVK